MKRAQRMQDVAGFGIDRVAAAITDPDVLRLENLDTDLPLPPEALAVTREALDDPISNSWLPFTGDMDLREAISDHIAQRHGRRYDAAKEIVVTCGGCEGVLDVLLATVDPGDEVVLTDPIYAGLVNRVRLAGGTPTFAPLTIQDGEWRLDHDALKHAITSKTTALLMMSPSMPTGCVLDRDDWAAVAKACNDHDLLLIYDAAMEAILFDGRAPVSPLDHDGMAERTVIVGSMSKAYRMIGWRVGWIAGPQQIVSDAGWVHVYNTTGAVSVARKAATAVLRGPQDHVQHAKAELQRRRDAIFDALPGQRLVRPGGGWSLLVEAENPAETSNAMLEAGIAATPMTGWGANVAARYVRFVFSAEPVERLATLTARSW
ncbi:MAG TPA: pyridoxal phosphate-dependent aminotransferase [Solirubrobacter sp.]|nr:pyridoxal phosphate-dependent aminotransferase [Solirubrobacter sp.]